MVDTSLRPRHMACSKPDLKSDRCRGCAHLPVHDECFTCKEDRLLGCPGCKPVTEANQ
jgi:hypothetical protein